MSLITVKASTQDGSSGTPVSCAVNENGSSAIASVALVGNKTTWAESHNRSSVTAADTAVTDLTNSAFGSSLLVDCENALSVSLRATCNTANSTLTGRLVHYDSSGTAVPLSLSGLITFVSDANRTVASSTFACPRPDPSDLQRARKVKFYVETLSASTTWDIYITPI